MRAKELNAIIYDGLHVREWNQKPHLAILTENGAENAIVREGDVWTCYMKQTFFIMALKKALPYVHEVRDQWPEGFARGFERVAAIMEGVRFEKEESAKVPVFTCPVGTGPVFFAYSRTVALVPMWLFLVYAFHHLRTHTVIDLSGYFYEFHKEFEKEWGEALQKVQEKTLSRAAS